jgi:hypothetical protein
MNTLEQIRQEITSKANQERAAEQNAEKREEETRNKLEEAQKRKAAALDTGDLEEYKAAGLESESLRLELEFIERSRGKGRKPAADTETDKRIVGALRAEGAQVRADALAQLRQIFTEAQDVSKEAAIKLAALDALLSVWDGSVMHRQKEETRKVSAGEDGLIFASITASAKAQIERFRYIRGC